jgi:hypothetical protein
LASPDWLARLCLLLVGKNFDPKKVEREFQFSALRDPGFSVSWGLVSGQALAYI